MSFHKLSENDKQIVLQCLNAILNGNFLEHEFQTRLGLEPEDLAQVVSAYPNIDDSDDNSNETLAINNCLNEVSHGISFSDREWAEWFTVERSEVAEVFRKWAILRGWAHAKLSNIIFIIRPTLAWSSETNQLSSDLRRQADIYVFCLLDHREKATLDPMRLEQWKFYLLRSAILDERFPTQKTISLASLLKLQPLEATFENLAERVAELAREK